MIDVCAMARTLALVSVAWLAAGCETKFGDVGRVHAQVTAERCPDATAPAASCPEQAPVSVKPWCAPGMPSEMMAAMTIQGQAKGSDGKWFDTKHRTLWNVRCLSSQCVLASVELDNLERPVPISRAEFWLQVPPIASRAGNAYTLRLSRDMRLTADFDSCTLSYTFTSDGTQEHGSAVAQ